MAVIQVYKIIVLQVISVAYVNIVTNYVIRPWNKSAAVAEIAAQCCANQIFVFDCACL